MTRPTNDQRFPVAPGAVMSRAGATIHDRSAANRRPCAGAIVRIALIVCLAAVFIVVPAVAESTTTVPSPLSGPGVGDLKKSQRKKIDRGWRALNEGDRVTSRKRISSISRLPAAQLLELQILRHEQNPEIIDLLSSFCDNHSTYAAAWVTLSISAEEIGLEGPSIEAARRGAELWPTSAWAERPHTLYSRWVDDRIVAARSMIDAGKTDEAGAELDAALALDPERRDAVFLVGRIRMLAGESDEADEILADFPELPEAIYLRGTIAEERGNWQSAMELFSVLPADYPGRAAAIKNAQTKWRLTLLPGYSQAAMQSTAITRGELAVILVSLQPRLKTLPGGEVPVMSDIVDDPGQTEIITAVRLGIMQADRRGHLFLPNAPVRPETVKNAVNRAITLLGLPPRNWCTSQDMVGSGCYFIGSPPDGESVVRAVLDTLSGAE